MFRHIPKMKYHTDMKRISIVCLDEMSGLETIALRGMLEYFGFLVSVHWIGNKAAFEDVLSGKTQTEEIMVLSSHGADGKFYLPTDEEIGVEDLKVQLPGKIVISAGCDTGSEAFAKKFLNGGCSLYIAPKGYPEGNDALVFMTHLFWALAKDQAIPTAYGAAQKLMPEGSEFALFENR